MVSRPQRRQARGKAGRLALNFTYEMLNSAQSLLELFVRSAIAHAHVPSARRTESTPRDDRDVLLGQEPFGELVGRETRRGDPRERVERATRLEGLEADTIEAVDQQAPTSVVLGDHRDDRGFAGLERGQRRVLGDGGRRHDPVLVDFQHPLEDRGGCRDVADPPAGHRVSLGEAAHQYRSLAHPGQRAERPVAVATVGQAVVDLVAVHNQVMALGDPGQLVLHGIRQYRAGRVARVAQEQCLCPRRDRGLHRRRVQREVVLEARGDRHDRAAGEHDRGNVSDVARLVENHLIARVAGSPKRQVHGLGRAYGDQDLRGWVVLDAVTTIEMIRERPTQLNRPVVGSVVSPASVEGLNTRGYDLLRGVEVRLSHPETDHLGHGSNNIKKTPYP